MPSRPSGEAVRGSVYPSLGDLQSKLLRLEDPQLILLKGHMLAEQQLTHTVADRLRIRPTELRSIMPFGVAVDIVFAGHDSEISRSRVLWFNDLRNRLAHDFDVDMSPGFHEVLRRYGCAWPSAVTEQKDLAMALTFLVMAILFSRGNVFLQEQLADLRKIEPPGWDPADDDGVAACRRYLETSTQLENQALETMKDFAPIETAPLTVRQRRRARKRLND